MLNYKLTHQIVEKYDDSEMTEHIFVTLELSPAKAFKK